MTGSSTVTYAYDANGNLATKNDGVYQWTYTFDYDNRLTRVQRGNTTMEQMIYDGDGPDRSDIRRRWMTYDILCYKPITEKPSVEEARRILEAGDEFPPLERVPDPDEKWMIASALVNSTSDCIHSS